MSRGGKATGQRDRWHLVPMVGWVRSYERGWLRGDLIAGIAVAALIVPKNLGYAAIAGIPVQNGLYAAAAGAILYAVFGTSRQISTGPSSGLAAVAASAVVAAKITGTQDVASFVATITLASGVLFLLLAVFKMGWIAQFLSRAVVTGFLFGAAIDVVIGELPKLTGTDVTGSNPLQELRSWFGTLSDASLVTVLVGGVSLAVVFGLRAVAPRIPGALVLVVGGLLASRIFDLGAHGVALVGEVPRGLPSLELPKWQQVSDHASVIALAAVALVLIGFSQTAGDSRTFAAKHRYRIDINQESVAQGMANAGAGLFQGMPVSTSLSASSLNDHSGARTGLASLTSGVIVLLTLLVLAPLFSKLPKPVLAALIIEAVVMGMMDVPEMRRLAKVQRFDFWIAMAAIAGTLVLRRSGRGLDRDRAVAAVAHLGRHSPAHAPVGTGARHPGVPGTGRAPRRRAVPWGRGAPPRRRPVLRHLRCPRRPGPRSGLVHAGITGIVLDCEGIDFIDSQGSAKLGEILELTRQAGLTLRLARIKPAVLELLERDGFLDRIGQDKTHGNVYRAVAAQMDKAETPDPAT